MQLKNFIFKFKSISFQSKKIYVISSNNDEYFFESNSRATSVYSNQIKRN